MVFCDTLLFEFSLTRLMLNAGNFSLHLCAADATLWVTGGSGPYTIEANTELFGFGSGGYSKGSEAADMMSDTSEMGRWLLFKMGHASDLVILEKQRQCPEHLEGGTYFNKASL